MHVTHDLKHDGGHKAHLVAGGHMTEVNTDSVYSGVVSLCSIQLMIFLAELNQLELWGAGSIDQRERLHHWRSRIW
jgi:hypothetical protein